MHRHTTLVDARENYEEDDFVPPPPDSMRQTRWRWLRLLPRRHELRLLRWPPTDLTGLRVIRAYHDEGYDIGMLVWQVCAQCRRGSINKVSLAIEWQRQGIGRRLINRALSDGRRLRLGDDRSVFGLQDVLPRVDGGSRCCIHRIRRELPSHAPASPWPLQTCARLERLTS